MRKYIDAEKLGKDLDNKFDNLFHNGIESVSTLDMKNILMNILIEQPVVDAVEVVRCKDCVHLDGPFCDIDRYFGYIPEYNEFFCDYGERKE